MKKIGIAAALAGSLFVNSASAASLIGDDILVSWLHPDVLTSFAGPENHTVGGGVEISCPGISSLCSGFSLPVSIDIDATSITYQQNFGVSFEATSFNGFFFDDLDFGGSVITGFSILTSIIGLDASRGSFTDNSFRINMAGLDTGNFTVDFQVSAVPIPATLPLFAAGLGLLGFGAWRRKSKH